MNTLRSLCSSAVNIVSAGVKNTAAFLCPDIYNDVRSIVQDQEPKRTKYLRIASVAARVIGSIGMACCGPSCILEFPTSFELAVISHTAAAKIHARAAQEMKSLCMEALSAQFCPSNIGFHCFPPRTALATIRATGALINSTAITLLEKSTAAAHNAIVDALDSQLIHHAANIAITVASYATYICGANIQVMPPYGPPVIPLPNPWKDESIAITTHSSSGDEKKKDVKKLLAMSEKVL